MGSQVIPLDLRQTRSTSTPSPQSDVIVRGGIASVVLGPVLVTYAYGAATKEDWTTVLWEQVDKIIEQRGACWVLDVIADSSPIPSMSSQKEGWAHIQRWGEDFRCASIAVLGDDLRASFVRLTISTMARCGRAQGKLLPMDSVAGAIGLLRDQMGAAAQPAALLQSAVQRLEKALGCGK